MIHLAMATIGVALSVLHPDAFLAYACLTALGGLAVVFGILR